MEDRGSRIQSSFRNYVRCLSGQKQPILMGLSTDGSFFGDLREAYGIFTGVSPRTSCRVKNTVEQVSHR